MENIEKNPELDNMDEATLCQIMRTILEKGIEITQDVLENETLQDITQIGEDIADAVDTIRRIRKIASIPTKLFMNKFVRYCQGMTDIPLEQRQRFLTELGKDKFNQEGAFTLNVIQKIEEKEKIPLLLKLLGARVYNQIDDIEYRRLMILTDRTLYNDLLYLKENITADPVSLKTEADYGLAASGLLVTAGNGFIRGMQGDSNSSILFNYTISAKKLSHIFFGTKCSDLPTNIGIIGMATV